VANQGDAQRAKIAWLVPFAGGTGVFHKAQGNADDVPRTSPTRPVYRRCSDAGEFHNGKETNDFAGCVLAPRAGRRLSHFGQETTAWQRLKIARFQNEVGCSGASQLFSTRWRLKHGCMRR